MKLDILVPFYNEEECLNEFVHTQKTSLDTISGSSFPLRINLFLMLVSGSIGLGYAVYSIIVFFKGFVVPGWTSTIALIALLFCAMFGALAIISEYISRIYADVCNYPLYHIRPEPKKADFGSKKR